MYIYYITCYYTTISLSTLYYKKYCKNTNTLFFPGCSTVSIYRVFGGFSTKKNAWLPIGQRSLSLCQVWVILQRDILFKKLA